MNTLRQNYLFVGDALKAHLTAHLGAEVPVEGIDQLSQAGDADKRPVVVYVMWAGDQINTSEQGRAGTSNRGSQMLTQRWAVLLRVLNLARGDARNTIAGEWLSRLHFAVHGWVPAGAMRPMHRSQDAAPRYDATSALYMLAFEINLVLPGSTLTE